VPRPLLPFISIPNRTVWLLLGPKITRPNLQQVHSLTARPSFPIKRPTACRPLLTEGLALSGFSYTNTFYIYSIFHTKFSLSL
jgi:hypothetical protein